MGVRYFGVSDPGYGQFVRGTGKAPVASATLGQSPAGDHGALLGLLLDQAGVGGAAGRCFLLRGTKSEEPETTKSYFSREMM